MRRRKADPVIQDVQLRGTLVGLLLGWVAGGFGTWNPILVIIVTLVLAGLVLLLDQKIGESIPDWNDGRRPSE